MSADWKFSEGQRVVKPEGYPFPGVVVAAFITVAGRERYVVEYVDRDGSAAGLLHIFAPEQLEADERYDTDGNYEESKP